MADMQYSWSGTRLIRKKGPAQNSELLTQDPGPDKL